MALRSIVVSSWTTREARLHRRCSWRLRNRCRLSDSYVHQVFQLFAGLEERDLLGGDFNFFAGLGIASRAGLALPGAEAAKTAYLDFVARAQGTHHAVKDRFHDHFAILARKFR